MLALPPCPEVSGCCSEAQHSLQPSLLLMTAWARLLGLGQRACCRHGSWVWEDLVTAAMVHTGQAAQWQRAARMQALRPLVVSLAAPSVLLPPTQVDSAAWQYKLGPKDGTGPPLYIQEGLLTGSALAVSTTPCTRPIIGTAGLHAAAAPPACKPPQAPVNLLLQAQ